MAKKYIRYQLQNFLRFLCCVVSWSLLLILICFKNMFKHMFKNMFKHMFKNMFKQTSFFSHPKIAMSLRWSIALKRKIDTAIAIK